MFFMHPVHPLTLSIYPLPSFTSLFPFISHSLFSLPPADYSQLLDFFPHFPARIRLLVTGNSVLYLRLEPSGERGKGQLSCGCF